MKMPKELTEIQTIHKAILEAMIADKHWVILPSDSVYRFEHIDALRRMGLATMRNEQGRNIYHVDPAIGERYFADIESGNINDIEYLFQNPRVAIQSFWSGSPVAVNVIFYWYWTCSLKTKPPPLLTPIERRIMACFNQATNELYASTKRMIALHHLLKNNTFAMSAGTAFQDGTKWCVETHTSGKTIGASLSPFAHTCLDYIVSKLEDETKMSNIKTNISNSFAIEAALITLALLISGEKSE